MWKWDEVAYYYILSDVLRSWIVKLSVIKDINGVRERHEKYYTT